MAPEKSKSEAREACRAGTSAGGQGALQEMRRSPSGSKHQLPVSAGNCPLQLPSEALLRCGVCSPLQSQEETRAGDHCRANCSLPTPSCVAMPPVLWVSAVMAGLDGYKHVLTYSPSGLWRQGPEGRGLTQDSLTLNLTINFTQSWREMCVEGEAGF